MTPSATGVSHSDAALHPSAACPSGARRTLGVCSHGRTDKGKTRSSNEDQFLIATVSKALQVLQSSLHQPEVHFGVPQGYLFLVADGVGGSAAGGTASELAVHSIEHFAVETLSWCSHLRAAADGDGLLAEFKTALAQANDKLLHEARRRPELHGMATTLTLAYFLRRDLFVAHVGDSRCYLLRQNMLYRLTRDHTLVAEMVRRGLLKPEEAARHAYRHVVTNVVGGDDPGVQVEMHKLALEGGDIILLCSDGLTEMVPETEILNLLLAGGADPAAACDRLVNRANEKGGKDNVTAVVARFAE
jgi:serine/threonine protein phosphatase PrpC